MNVKKAKVTVPSKSLSNKPHAKRKQDDTITGNGNYPQHKKQRTELTNSNEKEIQFHGYYKCAHCGNNSTVFTALHSLYAHYRVFHPDKLPGGASTRPFKCPICATDYSTIGDFKSHVKEQHPNEKSLFTTCDICYKSLAKPGALNLDHVHTKTFYSCPKCEYADFTFKSLYSHVRSIHIVCLGFESTDKDSSELWICSHCLKVFYAGHHLEMHLAQKCPEKSKITGSFVETPILKKHLKMCTIGTFGCGLYVSSFSDSMHGLLHGQWSTGDGDAVVLCGMCPRYATNNISQMVKHLKCHRPQSKLMSITNAKQSKLMSLLTGDEQGNQGSIQVQSDSIASSQVKYLSAAQTSNNQDVLSSSHRLKPNSIFHAPAILSQTYTLKPQTCQIEPPMDGQVKREDPGVQIKQENANDFGLSDC